MTHDELLAKIDDTKTLGNGRANELKQALRTVVELHKPDSWSMCVGCNKFHRWENCPTIQAIEKELG